MTKKAQVIDVVASMVSEKSKKSAGVQVPGQMLMEGISRMQEAYFEFQKLREQEQTKRFGIQAARDTNIEQIRAQRDVIKRALADAFELRKTGLQALISAMDRAIDSGNVEALHEILDGMVRTIQSSPFKDIADMREQLSDKNFVLRLK